MSIKQLKPLGVLGGMGPLATQVFYGMVIENTDAGCDQDHVNMIIVNHAAMPDRTGALLSGDTGRLYSELLEDCIFLEESGACAIAVPCNTSHYFADKLQGEVGVPIINMIRETVKSISASRGRGARAGILATDGTVNLGLYQAEMEKEGIVPVVLSPENQKRTMKIIYDGIKAGGEVDFADFEEIEKELLAKGCDCAVMGCTELSCFMKIYGVSQGFYIDAMKVLATKAITAAGGRLRQSCGK
ncbi:MAG: amino acid racemase [Clostridiales bacterium]|nr:amino acid racemase [Clostridiales bacterium]